MVLPQAKSDFSRYPPPHGGGQDRRDQRGLVKTGPQWLHRPGAAPFPTSASIFDAGGGDSGAADYISVLPLSTVVLEKKGQHEMSQMSLADNIHKFKILAYSCRRME